MTSSWVSIEITLYGHAWQVTARVDLNDDGSALVVFDEGFGKKDGRVMWWRGCDLADRLPRVELERVECAVVARAREQLNASAMKRRAMKG